MEQEKIQVKNKYVQITGIAIGIFILVFIVNIVLQPYYIRFVEKEINLEIAASDIANEKSLSNYVRLKAIYVNDQEVDLSEISLDDKSDWKYDAKEDFLYNYSPSPSDHITLKLERVHSLKLIFIAERGSGEVDVKINNKRISLDLYRNTTWSELEYEYDSAFFVRPDKHIGSQAVLFASILLLSIVAVNRKRKAIELCYAAAIIIKIALLSLLLVILIYCIQYDNVAVAIEKCLNGSFSFVKSGVFIALIITLCLLITRRLWLSFFLSSAFFLVLSVINNAKLENRGVPLFPWDLTKFDEALSVVHSYQLGISVTASITLLIALVITIVLQRTSEIISFGISTRPIGIILLLILTIVYLDSSFVHQSTEVDSMKYRTYQVDEYYESRGFITAFLEYMAYSGSPEQPENYSQNTMRKIAEEFSSNVTQSRVNQEDYPNIIVIMSESFWDAERLDTVSFNEPLLPNFYNLEKESIHGELFTHVLSGGTEVTEFEVLTGFTGEFFPPDYMVYGKILDDKIVSAVSILKAKGYRSVGIHPYIETNYNRKAAYDSLGFDETFFEKDFSDVNEVRGYISDATVFNKILGIYDSEAGRSSPQFIFAVTMQNHGGYWKETITESSEVKFETSSYGDVAIDCMRDYFAGLHESDDALGHFIEELNKDDRKTIVVYFGDHMSDAGPKGDRMLSKASWEMDDYRNDYESHRVPFIVWSNKTNVEKDWGTMQAGSLLPKILQEERIDENAFWTFVASMPETYSAADEKIVVRKTNDFAPIEDMSDREKRVNEIYELLQYDYLWGKRYAETLWQ